MLNPFTGVTTSYSGTITCSAGVLFATQTAALPGYNVPGKVILSGVIIALQVGGGGSWTPVITQSPADPALTIAYTFTPGTPVNNFARLKVTQAP